MTCVTCKAGNRHTARHHQRETSALDPARQNRYTDPLHTASADRSHTFAVELENAGTPVAVISRLLGHSSTAVTSRYLDHLTNAKAVTALEGVSLPPLED